MNSDLIDIVSLPPRLPRRRIAVYFIVFASTLYFGMSGAAAEGNWFPESLKLPDTVQVHGFLSQAVIHSSDNNFLGKTDDRLAADFRELGVNGSWRALPNLQMAVQLVWRDAGKTDKSKVRVDYGLADYSFFSTESSLLGIRAGRVPIPLGLYNDTRDVASTRPGIFLPQSIYFDINRNLALSADGGFLYGEHRTEWGDLFLNIGVIHPRSDDPAFIHVFTSTPFGKFPAEMEGETSWVGRLSYEWQGGTVRLAVTYADYNGTLDPKNEGKNPLMSGSFRFNPLIFSAQYNGENWSLTGEYALRRTRLNNFGLNLNKIGLMGIIRAPDSDTTGESYYVQGTYKFNRYIEGMLRYDVLYWDRKDRNGNEYAAANPFQPDHSRFAKDLTVGLRFKLMPSLLLSAEYHRVNGTGWIAALENQNGTKQHWDLFSFMLSYDF
ncbi:MAG: hypothetical protein ACU826_12925 [Gammaproteobacteria bacterium]